jgi:hypothetical protein
MTDLEIVFGIVTIASFLLAIGTLAYQRAKSKKAASRDNANMGRANELKDRSLYFLGKLTEELTADHHLVKEYENLNHSIICALGTMNDLFAVSWIEKCTSEEEKQTWRNNFGMV